MSAPSPIVLKKSVETGRKARFRCVDAILDEAQRAGRINRSYRRPGMPAGAVPVAAEPPAGRLVTAVPAAAGPCV